MSPVVFSSHMREIVHCPICAGDRYICQSLIGLFEVEALYQKSSDRRGTFGPENAL